jgi:hypothetical protein
MLAMIAEDLAILERLAEEQPDPAVRRAVRAALEELQGNWPRHTHGKVEDGVPEFLRR